jgi:hypothetical protein
MSVSSISVGPLTIQAHADLALSAARVDRVGVEVVDRNRCGVSAVLVGDGTRAGVVKLSSLPVFRAHP